MKARMVHCDQKKESYISIRGCARSLGIVESCIRKYFALGWSHYRGYTFRWVDMEELGEDKSA